MHTIRKRRKYLESWEYESQQQLKKLILQLTQALSLIAYLFYSAGKLLLNFSRVFFIEQKEISHFLEQENLKRIELSSHQSFWLK